MSVSEQLKGRSTRISVDHFLLAQLLVGLKAHYHNMPPLVRYKQGLCMKQSLAVDHYSIPKALFFPNALFFPQRNVKNSTDSVRNTWYDPYSGSEATNHSSQQYWGIILFLSLFC